MLPAERGQVSQQTIGDVLRLTQGGDGALEISRVPKDDRGDEEVEAGGAVLLVLVSAIADFAVEIFRPQQQILKLNELKPHIGLSEAQLAFSEADVFFQKT